MLTFGFGEQQAQPLLDAYLQQLLTAAGNSGEDSAVDDNTTTTATALTRTISGGAGAGSTLGATDDSIPPSTSIDPLYFYARYLVWKLQRSHAKVRPPIFHSKSLNPISFSNSPLLPLPS